MYAAIVKLNTLTDAIGATAQHDDLFTIGGFGFALLLVG